MQGMQVIHLIFFCTFLSLLTLIPAVNGAKKGSMLGFNPWLVAPDSQYELMANEFGAGWVRLWELEWAWQQNPTDYAVFLSRFNVAKKHGMKVLALCVGSPSSKSGVSDPSSDKYPPLPQYYTDFAQYCAGFVRNGADAVEVWNEPNNDGFWKPAVNLTSHIILAEMVKAVYTAVKQVNSSAIVVVGGVDPGADITSKDEYQMAHAGLLYLQRLFTVPGFATSFDAMGLHPYMYGDGAHPHTGLYQYNLWAQIPAVVQLVRTHSGNKPLWFTEFGAPSKYYGCDISTQLIDFQQYFADIDNWITNNASMIGVVFIYQIADRTDPQYQTNIEGYFGVMYSNYTMKPSGQLVQGWARQELPSSTTSPSSAAETTSSSGASVTSQSSTSQQTPTVTTSIGSQVTTGASSAARLQVFMNMFVSFIFVVFILL